MDALFQPTQKGRLEADPFGQGASLRLQRKRKRPPSGGRLLASLPRDQRQRRSIVKTASQPPSTQTPARFQPQLRPSMQRVFEIWRKTYTRPPRPVSTWHML